jgi:hypothetical protein
MKEAVMAWESCYATPLETEAHVVKGFLEQYGVPCVLQSDRFGVQPLTFCALGQINGRQQRRVRLVPRGRRD